MKEAANEGAVQLPSSLCSEVHMHGTSRAGWIYQVSLSNQRPLM